MIRRSLMSQGARATIAVVALYAFVLQAFLAGMLPVPTANAFGFAELCSPSPGDGGVPTKHDAKDCCTAACTPVAIPLPNHDASAIAWPARRLATALFDPALPPPARGPPIHSHSPRGPPAV